MEILYHHITTPCGQPADVIISALQKFIRRGKTQEAARAAYELFLTGEELSEYLWERLMVISAEDVGMGQPDAPAVVSALERAAESVGYDSPDYPILFVHAVRYLCSCPKERGSSILSSVTKRQIRDKEPFELPDYVFDMHTVEGQNRGRDFNHFLSEAAKVYPEAERSQDEEAYWTQMEEELIRRRKEGGEL